MNGRTKIHQPNEQAAVLYCTLFHHPQFTAHSKLAYEPNSNKKVKENI